MTPSGEAGLPGLACSNCGHRVEATSLAWRCRCGGLLEVEPYGGPLVTDQLSRRSSDLWRYREALPVPHDPMLSMGEGMSPLLPVPEGPGLALKLDFLMPTLSFKDRGAVVLAGLAKVSGARGVVVDSSGNAGTAMAAYAARAALACEIFVPQSIPEPKVEQMRAHGSRVVVVQGDRQAAAAAALTRVTAAEGFLYASHAYHPYFLEGTKTFAFEVWEQLGGRSPSWLVLPAGNGSLVLGAHKGFCQLKEWGLAERVPRILAVQSEACAPLAVAWYKGQADVAPVTAGPTVAHGIAIAEPPRGAQVLSAVRASAGAVVAVGDDAVMAAHKDLAGQGVFVERTAAAAWAAVREGALAAAGGAHAAVASVSTGNEHLEGPAGAAGAEVVVALSGAGLKDAGHH